MTDRNGQRSRAHRRESWLRKHRRVYRPRQFRPGFETLESRIVLTAPAVGNVSPLPNSTDVTVSTEVSAVYDQPLHALSVNDQTVVVHGMQQGQWLDPPNLVDTSGNVVSVTPGFGISFNPGELVQTTLTAGITNPGGESGEARVWQFRAGTDAGSGFFNSSQLLGSSSAVSVAFGDFNGDTRLDAMVSTTTGNQIWWNTNGVLTAGPNLGGTGARVVLGDVDNDGDLDAIADKVYRNNGNGTFSAGQNVSGSSLGDIDADGDLDLLGSSMWRNNGSGVFTQTQSLGGQGQFGDVDLDGDLDAFVIKPGQGSEVWMNDGNGSFSNSGQSLGSGNSQAVDLGDVNGDGFLDALVGNGSNQADRIWLNDGSGLFSDSGPIGVSLSTLDAKLGDLDGDGDLDAVITGGDTRVGLNDGSGHFTFTPQVLNGAVGGAVALGDVDDDGDLDVLVGNQGGAADRIWTNQATPFIPLDKFENNNSLVAATDLNTSPFNLTEQLAQSEPGLTIHDDQDQDWFRWTAPETGTLTVSALFSHALGDLDLKLYNGSGTQLVHANTQSDNETIVRSVTAGETFYIEVFGFGGVTNPNYELKVSGSEYPPDIFEGAKGNDSKARAVDLGTASQVLSDLTIHNPGRDDWFKITAPKTGAINVDIFFTHTQGDLDLQIIRGTEEIAISESSTDNEHVSFTGVAGQSYFVHVYGFEAADTSPGYRLEINTGNDEPVISGIPNQVTSEDISTSAVSFTVSDESTPAGSIVVTGTSNNTTLIPNGNIFFGGSGGTRTVMVAPAPNRSGTATITVTADDTTGGKATTTFVVTVNAVAHTPNLTVFDASGSEDTNIALNIMSSLNDPDGSETLTVLISGVPTGAGAGLSAGTDNGGGNWTLTAGQLPGLTIRPRLDDTSTIFLGVTARATEISNQHTAEKSGTIKVSVFEANDPPVISPIADRQTNEDSSTGPIAFTVSDSETPAASLVVSATSNNQTLFPASNVVLQGSGENRTVTLVPATNLSGSAVITVSAFDGINTTLETFIVTVNPVNDAPTISNIADQTINEDTSTGAISFVISDVESAAGDLTVTATSSDQTIVPNANIGLGGSGGNRTISVSPAMNQNGKVTISVTVSDGISSSVETFDVTIIGTNDVPSITPIPDRTIDEDTSTGPMSFTISDPDSAPGEITVTAHSSDQTLIPDANITIGGSGADRTITVVPGADQNGGPVTIVVTVADEVAPATESFNVTVLPVNDAPRVANPIGTVATNQDAPDAVFDLSSVFFDVDVATTPGHQLTYVARFNSNTSLVRTQLSGSILTLDFQPGQFGDAQIILRATDNGFPQLFVEDTIAVHVSEGNNPPTISPIDDQTTAEGTPTSAIAFAVDDTETPAGSLTVTATSSDQTLVPNANIVLGGSGADRTLTITPANNQVGNATITVIVSDGTNESAPETFQLTVTPVNDPPTISAIGDQTTAEDTAAGPITFTVGDPDTPLGSLTVTAVSSDQTLVPNGNIVVGGTEASRTITVTPAENLSGGPVTITVRVNDGTTTVSEPFELTVTAVNDAPTISNIPNQTTPEDTPTSPIAFSIGDVETPAAGLTVTVTSDNQLLAPNANILVSGSGANRTLTITPAADQSGSANITVTVEDADGAVGTESFVLSVGNVNDPPTISEIANQTTPEDTSTAAISFTVADRETAAGSLTVTGTSSNTSLVPNANITIAGTGTNRTVAIRPAANRSGSASITLTVRDGEGAAATETFQVTVQPVNDGPVNTVPATQTVAENAALVFSPGSGNAISVSDVDAGTGSMSLKLAVSSGRLILATTSGLTSVAGNGTDSIVLAGPLAAVNSALNGMTYAPLTNFHGTAALSLTSDDNGNTGAGGPKSDSDSITLNVSQVNAPPQITSGDKVSVPENTTSVSTVMATDGDGDPVRFTVNGGADQAQFAINSITGAVSFGSPKDFENPTDANGDNVYEVQVQASDGQGGTDLQLLRVTVTNVSETAPTVTILDVSPDPRAGAVDAISIVFSEAVTGLDLSDLTLTRKTNSSTSLLPGSATLTTTDHVTWTLGNLDALTASAGIYELNLTANGSGITSGGGVSLAAGDTERWINGPGDANLDGSFDQLDLVTVLQGGKYITGSPATWSQGDWNGDGVFNPGDIIVALQANHYLKGPFASLAAAVPSDGSAASDAPALAVTPRTSSDPVGDAVAADAVFEVVGQQEDDLAVPNAADPLPVDHRPLESSLLDYTLAKDSSDPGDDADDLLF